MRIRLIHISFVIISLCLFSCAKEVSYEGPPGARADFRAMINGAEWIAIDSAKAATMLGGTITLSGISWDGKEMNITLDDTVTGLYALDQGSLSLASYSNVDSSDLYAYTTNQGNGPSQAGGTVTVTAIDRNKMTLSGTFSFNMYRDIDGRQIKVTEGVFANIPYSTSPPPANMTDTMTATINDRNWIATNVSGSAFGGQIAIGGSGVAGSLSVNLLMPDDITGVQFMDINAFTYVGLYNPTPTIVLASASGILEILENDPLKGRIRGNFAFEATESLGVPTSQTAHITNGYFSVKYK